MKILFVMPNVQYVRNFESVIVSLADRGHQIIIGHEGQDEKIPGEFSAFVDALLHRRANVSLHRLPVYSDRWTALSAQTRILRDYFRYQQPFYHDARKCADRAAKMLVPGLRRRMHQMPPARRARVNRWGPGLMAAVERIVPINPAVRRMLKELAPDLMLITPLIDLASDQTDYVKAARQLGIPSGLCVASWDNLTNKGLIKAELDRVFVWNEAQKREAIELHGVAPDNVVVTGAQLFDIWFDYKPSRSREEFCRQVGLDPARPFLLYTGSSVFIYRFESDFIIKWLALLRSCGDPRLSSAGVLVRPHPKSLKHTEQWDAPGLADAPQVAIFPRGGGATVTEAARNDYFDSLYHAAAVVGINTSAMLEAGILGRRCFTVLADELRDSQEGMVHFQHLMQDGFLVAARSFEEHFNQLGEELAGTERRTVTPFVESFLRPHGVDRPATPIFVDAVERSVDAPTRRLDLWQAAAPLLRPLLAPAAAYVRSIVENEGSLADLKAKSARPSLAMRARSRLAHIRKSLRKSARTLAAQTKKRASMQKRLGKLVRDRQRAMTPYWRRATRNLDRFAAARRRSGRKAMRLTRFSRVPRRLVKRILRRRIDGISPDHERGARADALKIHVSLHSLWYLRNIAPVVDRLAERGHRLSLSSLNAEKTDSGEARRFKHWAATRPTIRLVTAPERQDRFAGTCDVLRRSIDSLFFSGPKFSVDHYPQHLHEAASPERLWKIAKTGFFSRPWPRALLVRALCGIERAVPCDPDILAWIRREAPDVMILTPFLGRQVTQLEYLRCAKALRIPTIVIVHSWDNLSSKSLFRLWPERIAVWNDRQVREAVELHDVPMKLIAVTGAQNYDEWFDRRPSTTREDFCRAIGLPSDRMLILYLCSATYDFKAVPEHRFVFDWIAAVRASSDPRLREAAILVRPHPKRATEWIDLSPDHFKDVAVWPKAGQNPIDEEQRATFFDSLHHAGAVVGLNTSAMIEAGILGRPVLTVLHDSFRTSQEGTYHFRYLTDEKNGLLTVARGLEEHVGQLSRALAEPEATAARLRRFVGFFVRPRGIDQPATSVLADVIEETARVSDVQPVRRPFWSSVVLPIATRAANTILRDEAEEAASRQSRIADWRKLKDHMTAEEREAKRAEVRAQRQAGRPRPRGSRPAADPA